jgi:uncharacterized protein (TIGR03000 family)
MSFGCGGCYGGWDGWGYGYAAAPAYVAPAASALAQADTRKRYVATTGRLTSNADASSEVILARSTSSPPDRALVVIRLPADARLYLDDQPTRAERSSVRSFQTPALEPGVTYYYSFRMEVVRDGERITRSRRVSFRAGQEVQVTFRDPNAALATVGTHRD